MTKSSMGLSYRAIPTPPIIAYYRWFARTQRLSHALGLPAASGSNMLVRWMSASAAAFTKTTAAISMARLDRFVVMIDPRKSGIVSSANFFTMTAYVKQTLLQRYGIRFQGLSCRECKI